MSLPSNPPESLTFEDAMERLEDIVSAMEAERLPLEEMVRSYEEGAGLLKVCRSRIEAARQRVELITARLDEPAPATLTPFDPATAPAEGNPQPDPTSRPAAARSVTTRRSAAKPATSEDDQDIRLL
jgi:exodeoxyribonuclease VII small subunit